MKPKNKYKKVQISFLISTFAGIAGLYIAYKFDSAAAKNISYILFEHVYSCLVRKISHNQDKKILKNNIFKEQQNMLK